MKTKVKEAVEHSTIHALPIVINSRSRYQRGFWLVIFICASLLLVIHLHRLVVRFMDHEVSTSIRTFSNATVRFPTIYVTLFSPRAVVDFPVPYKVVQRTDRVVVFELSDWSALESRRDLQFELKFCSASYYYQFGYIEAVDPTISVWSPLQPSNTIIQRGQNTLLIDVYQISVLPDPFSICMSRYPSTLKFYDAAKPDKYSQRACSLECSLSVRFMRDCNCSMRDYTGFDLPDTTQLASCQTVADLPADKANITDYAKKTDNSTCIWDPDQWLAASIGSTANLDLLRDKNISLYCNDMCHDDCNYLMYETKGSNTPIGFDDKCKAVQDPGFFRSLVTVDINDRITISREQEDYPLIEFLSETVGILGAYLGFSVCTMGEFIEIAYYLMKPHVRKLLGLSVQDDDEEDVEATQSMPPKTPRRMDLTTDSTERRGSFDFPGEYQWPQPKLLMASNLASVHGNG